MAATWFHAVFDSQADVRMALDLLAKDGVGADDIEVRSSCPLPHDLVPAGSNVKSRVPWMAVLGGFVGGTALFNLLKFASEAYELPTGGMPIVAMPPAGVVTFEGVAIGAILFTVATVLVEGRLPALGRAAGPLDHHIAADRILVTVRSAEGASRAWASHAMATEEQT